MTQKTMAVQVNISALKAHPRVVIDGRRFMQTFYMKKRDNQIEFYWFLV